MASNEASFLDALSQSHKFERLSFSCNSPKRIIACSVPTPILRPRAFSLKDALLDFFIGGDVSDSPFQTTEIPLPLDLLGSTGDLYFASSEVVIIAVGGRICWIIFGAFLIGRGRTPLCPNLTPYSEFDGFFLQHPPSSHFVGPLKPGGAFCCTCSPRPSILLCVESETHKQPHPFYSFCGAFSFEGPLPSLPFCHLELLDLIGIGDFSRQLFWLFLCSSSLPLEFPLRFPFLAPDLGLSFLSDLSLSLWKGGERMVWKQYRIMLMLRPSKYITLWLTSCLPEKAG